MGVGVIGVCGKLLRVYHISVGVSVRNVQNSFGVSHTRSLRFQFEFEFTRRCAAQTNFQAGEKVVCGSYEGAVDFQVGE